MSGPAFLGIPLTELRIDAVEWVPGGVEHMRARRAEQGAWCPEPEWVSEAALDPRRVVRVAIPDRSLKVIGWSGSAERLLKTWLWPSDLEAGMWLIGSATEANTSDAKRYKEAG